jgi:hypothetical protein
MRAMIRYGKVRDLDSVDPKSTGLRLSAIVGDVLGLRIEQGPEHVYTRVWLAGRYGVIPPFLLGLGTPISPTPIGNSAAMSLAVQQALAGGATSVGVVSLGDDQYGLYTPDDVLPRLCDLLAVGRAPSIEKLEQAAQPLQATFHAAALAAADGRLSETLGRYLAGLRRLPDGTVEVDDLPTLAAWALDELLRSGPVRIRVCASCELPFVPERDEEFCYRPAPGASFKCGDRAAEQRYKAAHGDFHRQRRRLYDRMKRGTLAPKTYEEWLAANRPGPLGDTWIAFADWQAGKRPKATRKGGKNRGKR